MSNVSDNSFQIPVDVLKRQLTQQGQPEQARNFEKKVLPLLLNGLE